MLSALHTWTLTAIAIAAGVAMLWAFGRFSDQARIEVAKRKLHAHLLAFRLFSDEPRLILRAQRELLIWNGRYLALMLRPTLVMILPLAALLWHLDAVYGHRALAAGEAVIVTAQLDAATNLQAISLSPEGRGLTVETPPLRFPDEHQVLWRVRAASPASAGAPPSVDVWSYDVGVEELIQVGSGLSYLSKRHVMLSRRHVTSWLNWLRYPSESRGLGYVGARWIEISYPDADIGVFGIGMHWLIWFCIVNLFTMLALRKRFGVTF